MIKQLKIEALKSINVLEIDCKKLNLFTGTNSSGKSTTLQALLLLIQNLDRDYGLNGTFVSIGDFREARNFNIKKDSIKITVNNGIEEAGIEIDEKGKRTLWGTNSKLSDAINCKNGKIHYISCNRIGSQDVYSKNISGFEEFGINGQYAIDFLCKYKDEPLEEDMAFYKENYTLLAQVNFWLKYIVDATIKPEVILGTDVVKASFGLVDGMYSRPRNVGSGISYLISIIIACLGSKKGSTIIIENPEIHLHPLSQSRVCEFLYFVAENDRQIFIETHSDHILDAVRVGIATKKMNKNDIGINFLKLGSDNCTRNYVIEIGDNGKIVNPIPNFFDQFELDLNKMLGI